MTHKFISFFLFAGLFALSVVRAEAGTATGNLQITVFPPLAIVFNPAAPTVPCNAAAGTVVSALSVTGGDGNAITYSATGGDTTSFAVTGTNVVVGSSGIAAADCPATGTKNVTLQVAASQQ